MKQLYAPWREDYTLGVAHTKSEGTTEQECVFCNHFKNNTDADNLIIRRFKHIIVMLNRYPYNAGHLLLLPIAHVASLNQMSHEARIELIELTSHCVDITKNVLGCDGANVGINLGKAAGAGIPSHLHTHVLPRFVGDTNWLPTLADTKQISFDLGKIYQQIKPHFDEITL